MGRGGVTNVASILGHDHSNILPVPERDLIFLASEKLIYYFLDHLRWK